ncbi:hypothetical protein D9611_012418 [Ephemerocybe angulata]|uniref:Ribonuclease H1 N-terminal domain-containing protein n=1 Tax=Ephemerocybe angulata TaxID=980116 RepID=A0A8H5FKS4_9AGAR|nr:hypothetical protein D9611_012418 [Tulosesus angulatus]
MAGHSNVKEEGAAAILGRATLSPAMLRLLGNLIRAIDARHLALDDHARANAIPGREDVEPITCPRCRGSGITMIYSASEVEEDDDDDDDDDDLPPHMYLGHPSLPTIAVTGTPGAGPSGAAASVTAAAPAPVGAAAATVPLATSAAGTAPSAPVAPSAATAPVTAATPAPVGAAAATGLPATPAAGTAPNVSVAPAVQVTFPVSTTVPLPVSPTPGFHSLGPNVPPPTPPNAVYTDSSADRFYTVTRGIRVGVFGGWMNTSPNVTGVPAASYTRHRTLQAAYEAYVSAYNSGIVTHA